MESTVIIILQALFPRRTHEHELEEYHYRIWMRKALFQKKGKITKEESERKYQAWSTRNSCVPYLDWNIAAYYGRIDYIMSFMTMSINKHIFLGELDAISFYSNELCQISRDEKIGERL